ncbi:MAG: VWA domain-containing protein, partial [Bacteroidetes bacterium]|nr:VWA domain-containing protein [Bacteroidota bacterium]
IKSITTRIEKPIIVLAVDQSQSILANKDSAFYRKDFLNSIDKLAVKLGNDYEVQKISFGEKISPFTNGFTFNQKQTNISELFSNIKSNYDNLNVGAVILASDGLYNKGSNPTYESDKLNFPIYTIALGDTTPQKDLKIKDVKHNEVAYIGNKYPINIEIEANDCSNERVDFSVSKNGKLIFSKSIEIRDKNTFINIPLEVEANESGNQHFVANISRVKNEISYSNNTKDFFIEVLDGKQKILLVSAAPHPDISTLKYAIESNKNYELKTYLLSEINKIDQLEAYNLVILHQVPSQQNNASLFINKIKEKRIPQLYILGSSNNISNFNNSQSLLSIQSNNASYNDALPIYNSTFGIFNISEESVNRFKNWPALATPFGKPI